MDAQFLREHIPHPYHSLDENGRIRVVNEAWLDLLGYDRAAVEGTPFTEFLTANSTAKFERSFAQFLETGSVSDVEFEMVQADGQTLTVQFDGELESENGSVRTHCQFRDVTESKQRTEKLVQTNTVLTTLVENLPFGILVEDADQKIIQTNDAFTEIFGIDAPAEALIGTDCGAAAAQSKDLFVDPEGFIDRIEELLERREKELHEQLRLKDGRIFERSYVPFRLPEGEANFWIYRDITERRRREVQMRKSQDVGDIGWWWRSIPSDEIYWSENIYEMWGIDETEGPIDHEQFHNLVHPEDRETVEAEWDAAKSTGSYDVEHRIQTDAEAVKWMREKAALTFDENGDPVSATGVVQDITERKRIETELEAQRDDLAVLNELLRHDVRNDLQLILGYAETIDVDPGSTNAEYVGQIAQSATHAVNLTETARNLSEALLRDQDLEPIAIGPVIQSEVTDQREQFPSASIDVDGSIPDVEVEADPRLESVVRNLVANAIQHNPSPNPTVRVAATAGDAAVNIRVADDGPGIPESDREQIFERGYTGGESAGTGLGLHLVSTLVDQYGGTVTVEDADLGGAAFALTLPTVES
jgi:PAS domain S-box-containing protein